MQEEVKGKWLWLGCSNEKNFKRDFEADGEIRRFELCTKLSHFNTMIETAHEGYEFMTLTGMDNIVADLTNQKLDEAILKAKLNEFFETLEELRVKKGMKIAVGPLLPWKKHTPEVKRCAVDCLKEIKVKFPGIKQIARISSLGFLKDNVHLTERASRHHFKSVYSASYDHFFDKEDEYLTEDNQTEAMDITAGQEIEVSAPKEHKKQKRQREETEVEPSSGEEDNINPGKPHATKHSVQHPDFQLVMRQVRELRRQVNERWTVDLLVMAGTKEDLDRIENNLNMNKVIIMGLDVPDLWEHEDWKLRIATIKDAVADLFNFINPGVDYNLGFVKHLNAKLKASRQIVEVTLDNEKKGRSIRKALAEKIKDWRSKKSFPDRMNGVTITPSLTLATRVRIAMLKTFASLLVKEFENTETWVIQHVARPVLKVEQTTEGGKKVLTSYGFAQSLSYILKTIPNVRFSDQELFSAYTIAGTRFGAEISHHFVILEMEKAEEIAKGRKQKPKSKPNKNSDKSKKKMN